MKRVIAKEYVSYNRMSDEYTYTHIQYLQQMVVVTFFGKKLCSYWETIDTEEVPSFAVIEHNTLGSTSWKSKWHEIEDVLWVSPKK